MEGTKRKTILLIDDEPDLRTIIRDELGEEYEYLEAGDGLEGFEKVKAHKPDLILSDINMPNLSGLDLLEKLREKGFETPLVLITAYSDTDKIRRAWALGAFDFLDKPIPMAKLRSVVKMALTFGGKSLQPEKPLLPNAVVSLEVQIHQKELLALHAFCKKTGISISQVLEDWIKKHAA